MKIIGYVHHLTKDQNRLFGGIFGIGPWYKHELPSSMDLIRADALKGNLIMSVSYLKNSITKTGSPAATILSR